MKVSSISSLFVIFTLLLSKSLQSDFPHDDEDEADQPSGSGFNPDPGTFQSTQYTTPPPSQAGPQQAISHFQQGPAQPGPSQYAAYQGAPYYQQRPAQRGPSQYAAYQGAPYYQQRPSQRGPSQYAAYQGAPYYQQRPAQRRPSQYAAYQGAPYYQQRPAQPGPFQFGFYPGAPYFPQMSYQGLYQSGLQQQQQCPAPIPLAGPSTTSQAQVLNPPPINNIFYSPANPPTYKQGEWPPMYDYSHAQELVVYEFEAQDRITNFRKFPVIRLPYLFTTGKPFDCVIKKHSHRSGQTRYCRLLSGTEYERRINITDVMVNGERRAYMQLEFRDPNTLNEYTSITWLVATYNERDDGPLNNYGYYTVSSENRIPLNAYKPIVFRNVRNEPKSVQFSKEKSFILILNWLPGLCINEVRKRMWIREELCNQTRFIIHGIFGTHTQDIDDLTFAILDDESLNVPNLGTYWPAVSSYFTNEMHWSKEWVKHGQLINFANPKEFFTTGMNIFVRPDMQERFNKIANISSDFEYHILDQFKDEIRKYFPKMVNFGCIDLSDNLMVLYEIRLCFEKTPKWEWVNCRIQGDFCYPTRRMLSPIRLFFPYTYHSYRYVTFTVFWIPTQIARMRAMKNDENQYQIVDYESVPEWRIHNLCPNLHLYWISVGYREDMKYNLEKGSWKTRLSDTFTPELQTQWPSLVSTVDPIDRWHYLYVHCGIYFRTREILKLRGAVRYFNFALEEKARINTAGWDLPLDTELTADQITAEIESKIGTKVSLICYRNKDKYFLVKVRICYDNDPELTQHDCPRFAETHKRQRQFKDVFYLEKDIRNCGKRIIIPSTVQSVV